LTTPPAQIQSAAETALHYRNAGMSNRNCQIVRILSLRRMRLSNEQSAMRTIDRVFRYAARSCGLPVAPDARVPATTVAKYRSVSLSDAIARWDPALGVAYKLLDHHKDASAFSSFLGQLGDTENYRTDPDFHAVVVALISRLIEQKDLRETCFAISRGAITARGNSIVGAFNRMAWARAAADIETGLYDGRPETAIALLRQIFRCEQLLNVVDEAGRHLQERRDSDRAEFYRTYNGSLNDALVPQLWLADRADIELTYQVYLRNRLELHLCIKYMDTTHILHNSLTENEINEAEQLIKKAENKTFDSYLSCSQLWQGYLERTDPAGFKKVRSALKKPSAGDPSADWPVLC
jgi:hypothetical protein